MLEPASGRRSIRSVGHRRESVRRARCVSIIAPIIVSGKTVLGDVRMVVSIIVRIRHVVACCAKSVALCGERSRMLCGQWKNSTRKEAEKHKCEIT